MRGRANSVINRTAPIAISCQNIKASVATSSNLLNVINRNRLYLGNYYYLFVLLESSGCRITEVLNVRMSDINSRGQIFIIGLKKGQNRLIECHLATDYLIKCVRNNLEPFASLNRFTAYRLLKNIGVGKVKGGNQVSSVTHIFRDNYVRRLRELNMTDADRSSLIGHKNTKSTEYYGKD